MPKRTVKEVWNIIYIDDFNREPQFAIRMDGTSKTISIEYRNYNYKLTTKTFSGDAVAAVSCYLI